MRKRRGEVAIGVCRWWMIGGLAALVVLMVVVVAIAGSGGDDETPSAKLDQAKLPPP